MVLFLRSLIDCAHMKSAFRDKKEENWKLGIWLEDKLYMLGRCESIVLNERGNKQMLLSRFLSMENSVEWKLSRENSHRLPPSKFLFK